MTSGANITSIKDLNGRLISVERGVSLGFEFERTKNIVFKVDEDLASIELRFKKLFIGRSDVLLFQDRRFNNAHDLEDHLMRDVFPKFNDVNLSKRKIIVSRSPLFLIVFTSHAPKENAAVKWPK